MKIKISGAAGLAALALAVGGCASSPIPVAKNFAYTAQEKVRSAGHWELLAGDVLNETAQLLARNGAERLPLYVELPAKPTEFEKGFRDFLITGLVQRGFQVKTNPEGAAVVSYNSQVVKHRSERPYFVPGQITAIVGGLYALHGITLEHTDVQLAAGLGLAALADWGLSEHTGGPTHTELILSTTVTSRDTVVARKTDVYYLEDADEPLFRLNTPPTARTMKMVAE